MLGAVLGIILLLASIACFPLGFAFPDLLAPFFILGVLLLSACLPVPIFILDKLDGRG